MLTMYVSPKPELYGHDKRYAARGSIIAKKIAGRLTEYYPGNKFLVGDKPDSIPRGCEELARQIRLLIDSSIRSGWLGYDYFNMQTNHTEK